MTATMFGDPEPCLEDWSVVRGCLGIHWFASHRHRPWDASRTFRTEEEAWMHAAREVLAESGHAQRGFSS